MILDLIAATRLSTLVLIITAGLLVYVAIADLRTYRIRNELVLVLAGLFFIYALLTGHWILLPWNIGFSVVVFLALLVPYSRGAIGGGDVKLLGVAFLWTGIQCALVFAVGLLLFSLLHILLSKVGLLSMVQKNGKARMAYGPSIAAALLLTFAIGCLSAMPGSY